MVIGTLLRAAEPMSRAELAKQTGLTKATMSLLVSMLVDNGVVREGTPSVQSSYGRPSTPQYRPPTMSSGVLGRP